MDIRSMLVFLSVAETLNFSRSAESLHMSLSAVSRTIQRLEEECGRQLLERDKRTVSLSSAGAEFREYAQRAVSDWQQLRHRFSEVSQLHGEVSLYCSVTASHRVLAPLLEAFRLAHSTVELKMHTGDQAEGIDRILAGKDDVAVCARPGRLSSRLAFQPLRESPLRLCAPVGRFAVAGQRQVRGAEVQPFDWAKVPFIAPERGVSKTLLDEWFRAQGIRPNIYAQVAGHEAIAAMVALGLGVGVVPELVIEAAGLADKVSYLALSPELPVLTIGLCSLRQRLKSPLVSAFWEVAGQTYTSKV